MINVKQLFIFFILSIFFACDASEDLLGSSKQVKPVLGTESLAYRDTALSFSVGASLPLSGRFADIGQAIVLAIEQELAVRNSMETQAIDFIYYDDGDDLFRSVQNTKKLILEDNVDFLIGYVGTQNAFAILPLLEMYEVYLFGLLSSAEFLRGNAYNMFYFSTLSYEQRLNAFMQEILQYNDDPKIAILYDNIPEGTAVYRALLTVLKEHGLSLHGANSFNEGSQTSVRDLIDPLFLKGAADYIILGTNQKLEEIMTAVYLRNRNVNFFNMIDMLSKDEIDNLIHFPGLLDNLVFSLPFPLFFDADLELGRLFEQRITDFSQDKAYEQSLYSFLGFYHARFLQFIYTKIETRTCLPEALYGKMLVDGVPLFFSEDNRNGFSTVDLFQLNPAKNYADLVLINRYPSEFK